MVRTSVFAAEHVDPHVVPGSRFLMATFAEPSPAPTSIQTSPWKHPQSKNGPSGNVCGSAISQMCKVYCQQAPFQRSFYAVLCAVGLCVILPKVLLLNISNAIICCYCLNCEVIIEGVFGCQSTSKVALSLK